MNITDLLKSEIDDAYKAADGLIGLVDADRLDWKPETGDNWMTTGELITHITGSCGALCRNFVSGQWDAPDDSASANELVKSPEEASKLLADDKQLALAAVDEAGEERLTTDTVPVPWFNNHPMPLGKMLLQMVQHLTQHKGQLFYYLKLQGKAVNTMHLWAGGE